MNSNEKIYFLFSAQKERALKNYTQCFPNNVTILFGHV